jgi:hypothetical protein
MAVLRCRILKRAITAASSNERRLLVAPDALMLFCRYGRNPLLLRLTLRERGKMPLESPVLSTQFSNRAMTKSQTEALLV